MPVNTGKNILGFTIVSMVLLISTLLMKPEV